MWSDLPSESLWLFFGDGITLNLEVCPPFHRALHMGRCEMRGSTSGTSSLIPPPLFDQDWWGRRMMACSSAHHRRGQDWPRNTALGSEVSLVWSLSVLRPPPAPGLSDLPCSTAPSQSCISFPPEFLGY